MITQIQQLDAAFRGAMPIVAMEVLPSDEERIMNELTTYFHPLGYNIARWSLTGILTHYEIADGVVLTSDRSLPAVNHDPISILQHIAEVAKSNAEWIFVLDDIAPFVDPNNHRYDPLIIRWIKNLFWQLRVSFTRVIIRGIAFSGCYQDFRGIVSVIEQEPQNPADTQKTLHEVVTNFVKIFEEQGKNLTVKIQNWEGLTRLAQGLTHTEIEQCCGQAVVLYRRIDERLGNVILNTKINTLKQINLQFADTPTIEVGGMTVLKEWLAERSHLFNPELHSMGFPYPKGVLITGVTGVGKSLIVKTMGKIFNMPILAVDLGAIYGGIVGQSESNLRQLLSAAEAVAPCILWIDEIEKGLAGLGNDNDGVTKRLFQKLLTWMNDHKQPIFIAATANNIQALPVEFTRRGRFDEIFFCDVPNISERLEILQIHKKRYNFDIPNLDLNLLAQLTEGYVGSELAAIIDRIALLHIQKKPIDYPAVVNSIIPVTKRSPEQIEAMRQWAKQVAVNASAAAPVQPAKRSVRIKH